MAQSLVPDRIATGRREPAPDEETDHRYACPLCGIETDDHTGVYVHLQTSHRKSALARELLGGGT